MAGCGPEETPPPSYEQSIYLQDIYQDYFKIGAAVSTVMIEDYEEIFPHFNSITAEYQMKWGQTEPSKGKYSYGNADKIVSWAKENGKQVRGHCLLWYKSLPSWVASEATDKESALQLIDRHVNETVEYFGDSVYCWDVLNEALHNTVTEKNLAENDIYRTGSGEVSGSGTVDWYALCGEEFIVQAFRSADEARKRLGLNELELYYNDYSLNNPQKREACVRLVKMLQREGVAIDGVGMQAHYRLPAYEKDRQAFMQNFEDSIKAFTELGVDVQITELDISVYASDSETAASDSLTLETEEAQAQMFADIFEVCRRYSKPWKEGAGTVTCVTTWGVADDRTSKDTAFHKDYPLIFGRNHEYKKAYYAITDF